MGYRSDVAYTIRFANEEAYHLFILEAKANPATAGCFPPNNTGTWEECICDEGRKRIDFHVRDVKWYESYPDVQGFEQAMRKFESLADDGDKWLWEFVRLGENLDDVEERNSYNSEPLLYVSRSIECDF